MTYTVNDKCIMCKHTDCVEVCPVDCFYEGENMLVIHPDECIDCGVCEPECPEDAIKPDTDEEGAKWVEFNGKWAAKWAVITARKVGKIFQRQIMEDKNEKQKNKEPVSQRARGQQEFSVRSQNTSTGKAWIWFPDETKHKS